MTTYKKMDKVLNNVGTDAYKEVKKTRELSDASMSARKKQEAPKKTELQGEKIKYKVLFTNGKVGNLVSTNPAKIASYIAENASTIVKATRVDD